MIAIVCFIASFNSCKKDNKEAPKSIADNYFTIENATLVNSNFPTASSGDAPSITAVFGNNAILEGGSNPISISTSSTFKEVLIGIQGETGYYRQDLGNLKSAQSTYLTYLLFSQNLKADNFTILIAIVDADGLISEHQLIEVSKITAGTGKLQVSCSWNKPNDIDLHLVEPNLDEISWRNDSSTNGGVLDVDSNPICHLDNINNENITYSGDAIVEKGKYIVRISLFSSCAVTEVTNFVVTARLDGNLIVPTTGTNPFYGTVEAAHSYVDGDGPGNGTAVMEFNVSSTKSALVEKQKMLKFSFPKKVNTLKRSMLIR
jgi:hypothetical protein